MNIKKKFGNEMIFITANFKAKTVKSWEDEKVVIEWFASTDAVDLDNDVVVYDVWTDEVINDFLTNPQMLLSHDMEKSIWKWTKLEKTEKDNKKGLWVEWEILHNIDVDGISLFERVKKWTTRTLSIWFFWNTWEFRNEEGNTIADENGLIDWYTENDLFKKWVVRYITNVKLFEISVVNVPANPQAIFALKKSLELNKYFIFENTYKMKKNNKFQYVLPSQLKSLEEKETNEQENNQEDTTKKELENEINTKIKDLIAKSSELDASYSNLTTEIETFRDEFNTKYDADEVTEEYITEVNAKIEQFQNSINDLNTTIQTYKDTITSLQEQWASIEVNDSNSEVLVENETLIAELTTKLDSYDMTKLTETIEEVKMKLVPSDDKEKEEEIIAWQIEQQEEKKGDKEEQENEENKDEDNKEEKEEDNKEEVNEIEEIKKLYKELKDHIAEEVWKIHSEMSELKTKFSEITASDQKSEQVEEIKTLKQKYDNLEEKFLKMPTNMVAESNTVLTKWVKDYLVEQWQIKWVVFQPKKS